MKVICDVCGTTFPETDTHCPICGCAKAPAAQAIAGDGAQAVKERSSAPAKGGRFSEKNVQRNNRDKYSPSRNSRERSHQHEKQNSSSNKLLIAIVIVLLLAIVSVVVYIAVKLILNDPDNAANRLHSSQQDADDQTGEDAERIPCTALNLGVKIYELNTESDQALLSPVKTPADSTDKLIYTSSDPAVATVDENGLVRPGTKQGEAIITVTCGDVTAECKVVSKVGTPVEPDVPEVPEVTVPSGFVLKLNRSDFSTAEEGFKWNLLKDINTMGVAASDMTWTSSDPAVATVENGVVVAVNRGTCTITASIAGQTATCIVRCNFDKAPETPYKLSHSDVTLRYDSGAGSFFNLELKDKETGAKQNVTWTASEEGVVEITDSGKITACNVTKSYHITVSTEYEGFTYSCVLHVHPKKAS